MTIEYTGEVVNIAKEEAAFSERWEDIRTQKWGIHCQLEGVKDGTPMPNDWMATKRHAYLCGWLARAALRHGDSHDR